MPIRLIAGITFALAFSVAAAEKLPHHQTSMPGPALSPDEAIAKMVLPKGFSVECVASEPVIVNPTAFTFDEKGRIWVCESIEYPRADAGPGKDRIKMLESTKGDGKFDKATVIKDGLNIPCGIVMGNGGFYYTNSPDIVFAHLDENGKVDKEEVILTGFGRADRHELPNSLTWGPDGWLYGLNGVFNPASITNGKTKFDFTCGVWRWHPQTRKFELFAEGTSNPWGLDYDLDGEWFVSCCVIKHLFHITQSGYYHRQGGPYPPFTHKIEETVVAKEEHFMAANGGLCIYNGSAFPDEFKNTYFMGNLHGSQVNRDTIAKNGATFTQRSAPDFIEGNDKWFMPVSQKVGPDGCLYVMDWYDKYHCYQDSGRPDLDRERGRIYRISYDKTPQAQPFDLKALKASELLAQFSEKNSWQRREAQRLLNEHFDPRLIPQLQKMALDTEDKTQAHRHALWLLYSQQAMDDAFLLKVLNHPDPVRRAWGVRMIGEMRRLTPGAIYDKLIALAADPAPEVRVQVPVAAGRLSAPDPLPVLAALLRNPENAKDPIIPNILYNNLKPLVLKNPKDLLQFFDEQPAAFAAFDSTVIKWARECAAGGGIDAGEMAKNLAKTLKKGDAALQARALSNLIASFDAAGLKTSDRAKAFDKGTRAQIENLLNAPSEAQSPAALIALWWKNPAAIACAKAAVADAKGTTADRTALLKGISELHDGANIPVFAQLFLDNDAPLALRRDAAAALGAIGDEKAASIVLQNFKTLPPELKSSAVNGMSGNPVSAKALLDALERKEIAAAEINSNNARSIVLLNDAALTQRVTALWGKVKSENERDPARVQVVNKMRETLKPFTKAGMVQGDVLKGWKVFEKNCQQCHKIYGKGNEVGPDLTGVGRNDLDLILNNVLDPNLVVGEGYYQHMVKTKDGVVLTGLLAEETEKSLTLKMANSEIRKLAKDDIALHKKTQLSLMPEELEKVMTADEFRDLAAFLLTKEAPK